MKRTAVITILVAAIALALVGANLARRGRPSPTDAATYVPGIPAMPNSLPFQDAISEPSIAAAEAALGWHIVRPHGCPADDSKILAIYVSTTNNQADITYQDLTTQSHCYPVETSGHAEVIEERSTQVLSDNPPTTPTLTQSVQQEATSLGPIASVQ